MLIMESSVYSYIASVILLWHRLLLVESSVNLALHKSTSQSSTFNSLYPSSNAVDGLNKQCVNNGFAHTLDGEYEWWQVDLGEMCEIRRIQIYYRTNLVSRLDGYAINLTKSLNPLDTWQCYKDTDNTIPTNPAPSHICPSLWRYVKFSREKTTPDIRGEKAVINLCELEVYGCPQGRYGNLDCKSNCSVGCLNSRCDPDNGHCNCSSGLWSGDKCDHIHCNTGSYLQGDRCVSCSTGCVDNNCNVGTGECAKGCKTSFYGTFCNLTCTQNCYNTSCARDSGKCIGCKVGFYGDKCDEICPRNCKDNACKQDDGYCTNCNYPYKGNTCTDCSDGSYFNRVICIPCSIGCLYNDCNSRNGECLNGCKQSFYGTFCNFTCTQNCYNTSCARDTGRCIACKVGFYGDNCDAKCSWNCKDNVCRQDSGYCTSCNYPYKGNNCTECHEGYYGDKCVPCSEKCSNGTCSKTFGHCSCKDSFFGHKCDRSCPANCKYNKCNQTTGECVEGCKTQALVGNKCSVCVVGLYGKDCDIACPVNCKHRMCDGTDGTCMFGCKYANMTGNQCDGFLTATTGTDNRIIANIGLIILGIISSINTIFIIIIILILYYKRRRRKETVYENQKVMGSPQTGTNQIENYNPEQPQTVHYETLGLSDRGSINTNSTDAYTGLNMIETGLRENDNS